MSRLNVVSREYANDETQALYGSIQRAFGKVPNIFQGIANSPAALKGMLGLSDAVKHGVLSALEREVIALTVAQLNGCEYCLSAHTLSGKAAGLSVDETIAIRKGEPTQAKIRALVNFVHGVVSTKGRISDEMLVMFKSEGYTDAHVVETILVITQNFFTNFFNNLNQTTLDFPAAPSVR